MTETRVSCGAVIPEGRQACPNCEAVVKKRMKWVQVATYDWEAKGSAGDFRVWKDGRVWRGRYRSANKQYSFFLPVQQSVRAMKSLCEDNYYWED